MVHHLQKVCMRAKRAVANQIEEVLLINTPNIGISFTKHLKPLCFEIDSAVAVTIIISRKMWKYFQNRRLYSTLQLITFCKISIQIVGVVITLREIIVELNLYVSNVNFKLLLRHKWIWQLHIHLTESINNLHTLYKESEYQVLWLLQQYKDNLDSVSTKIKER